MWPHNVKDWVEIAVYVVGLITALCSAYQYFRNSAQARTRWLFELATRFYGDSILRNTRVRLDEDKVAFVRNEEDSTLLGELDDYLNFFEFVGYLHSRKELKSEEIRASSTIRCQQSAKGSQYWSTFISTGTNNLMPF